MIRRILLPAGLLVLFAVAAETAWTADTTAIEIFQVKPGHGTLTVIAPFAGDDDGDNALRVEWAPQGSDWLDGAAVTVTDLPHGPSPYRHTIEDLTNHAAYQVRVTLTDPDGIQTGDPQQTFLEQIPFNPLVHSSRSTGSSKWPAGWGIPGGQYGEFTCPTCHLRESPNIKRVRPALAVTDPGSADQLPIQQDGGSVLFTTTTPNASDMGDDSDGHASSQRVCEACHSRNKYHNYDSANNSLNGGGTDHYNRADCARCHRHKEGFKVACNGCHDDPPEWGSHPAHLLEERMAAPATCTTCHKSSVHRNLLSEVRFDPFEARVAGATYSDQGADETSRYSESSGYGAMPVYGTCAQLYCHSNGAPFDGTMTYRQPAWGGAPQTCVSCHGDGVGAPLSGRHDIHRNPATYGYSCARCHSVTAADSSSILDNSWHVNKQKDVLFSAGGSYDFATRGCAAVYCHGDGRPATENSSPSCAADAATGCHYADRNGDSVKESLGDQTSSTPKAVAWTDTAALTCYQCHKGGLSAPRNAQMDSNAHFRLANVHWIRQYPCHYCHYNTVDAAGAIKNYTLHANEAKNIAFDPKWSIPGKPAPTYDPASKVCLNLYCHSDGTAAHPQVRDFPWDLNQHADCDSCHGHDQSDDCNGCHGAQVPQWSAADQWKRAMPMYANTGPGTERANSHLRHLETDFSCENCHATTVVGACGDCHGSTVPSGVMTEAGHVNAGVHVNKFRDVVFKGGGSYDPVAKKCTNTACHTGSDPVWGDSVGSEILCLSCHGTTEADIDDFDAFNGTQGRINMNEWFGSGHGRKAASGNYPSGNPPADFPGNPCWYCHDNEVLHKDAANPFRLKMHPQFEARFEKECVYCHMEQTDAECLACHNAPESLSPQLSQIGPPEHSTDHTGHVDGSTSCLTAGCHLPQDPAQCRSCHANPAATATQLAAGKVYVAIPDPPYSKDHADYATDTTDCTTSGCHTADAHIHNTGAGTWSATLKEDIRNQYLMMGVCLQCHDDDDNGRCTSCHTGPQYALGYDPGTGFKSGASKASSTHFGYKHFSTYQSSGKWGGGKFCWDCHDPHGDANIYMVQNKVATETDGTFGVPVRRAAVVFTKKQSGLDYAKISPPYDGICNVCHQDVNHYQAGYGDGHQSGRVCTSCHEHGFGDSHASGQSCAECHQNKPIANHLGFSQPRDCVKCHQGAILKRMDIMRQFRGKSHHVQGVEVTNRHCYACHWEANEVGLINLGYHEGYNYKTHTGTPNAKSDLVIWGPGERPLRYELGTTAQTFVAQKIGTAEERAEVAKVSDHCLGCHSDQNNGVDTFGDCRTPDQYAWDRTSIAARYLDTGTTNWGKSSAANAAKKIQVKAYSAHGNAKANQGGGWNTTSGEDGSLPSTREGLQNVHCFDCHSSHGSFTEGVTSSYVTFDGSRNGGNLKETQAGKGGYTATYRAQAKTDGINPMGPGAAQCFDCHETADGAASGKPWGYLSTFGATAPIMGYKDSPRFGAAATARMNRLGYRLSNTRWSSHLKAATPLVQPAERAIGGTCAGCHDPHGVSPTLGAQKEFGVPLLKGSWMTSPYREDRPNSTPWVADSLGPEDGYLYRADGTINYSISVAFSQDSNAFGGLCLRCHPKGKLTDGVNRNTAWKSIDRVHETVKGWGAGTHAYTCSKCHSPHMSNFPRLMVTNCLDVNHRGNRVSGGRPTQGSGYEDDGRFPTGDLTTPCHAGRTGTWTNQRWNQVTPW